VQWRIQLFFLVCKPPRYGNLSMSSMVRRVYISCPTTARRLGACRSSMNSSNPPPVGSWRPSTSAPRQAFSTADAPMVCSHHLCIEKRFVDRITGTWLADLGQLQNGNPASLSLHRVDLGSSLFRGHRDLDLREHEIRRPFPTS